MVVAVRVIKIFGVKDNCFSTLGDVTKNDFFSHLFLKGGGAEISSTEISDPENSILLPEF